MASQRASISKELLRESLDSVLKSFKVHSLDDGQFSCVPNGIGTQLVMSNIRLFSRIHSPRVRCEESVLSGYREDHLLVLLQRRNFLFNYFKTLSGIFQLNSWL